MSKEVQVGEEERGARGGVGSGGGSRGVDTRGGKSLRGAPHRPSGFDPCNLIYRPGRQNDAGESIGAAEEATALGFYTQNSMW